MDPQEHWLPGEAKNLALLLHYRQSEAVLLEYIRKCLPVIVGLLQVGSIGDQLHCNGWRDLACNIRARTLLRKQL